MGYQDRNGRRWIRTSPYIQEQAKALRRPMTEAERVLWSKLRGSQIRKIAFRRQHPYGPYIFDFYARSVKLIVEVDGGIHNDYWQWQTDMERDEICRGYKLTILRFTNEAVLFRLDTVIGTLTKTIDALRGL